MQVSKIAIGGLVVARIRGAARRKLASRGRVQPGSLDLANLREPRAYFLQRVAVAWGVPSLTSVRRAAACCVIWAGGRGRPGSATISAAAILRWPIAEEAHWPRRGPT
jgi:hypothetical protein